MKIVINTCYGGFGLSKKAVMRWAELKGITLYADEKRHGNYFYTIPVAKYREYEKVAQETKDWSALNEVFFSENEIPRNDVHLVQVVEELGIKSWGRFSELKVVDVPDDVKWEIFEYDGMEHVAEKHRIWN